MSTDDEYGEYFGMPAIYTYSLRKILFPETKVYDEDQEELYELFTEGEEAEFWVNNLNYLQLALECAENEYDSVCKDGVFVRDVGEKYVIEAREDGEWSEVAITPENAISDVISLRNRKAFKEKMDSEGLRGLGDPSEYPPYGEGGYNSSRKKWEKGLRWNLRYDGTSSSVDDVSIDAEGIVKELEADLEDDDEDGYSGSMKMMEEHDFLLRYDGESTSREELITELIEEHSPDES